MKIKLLLGRIDAIEEYAKNDLKINIEKDMVYYPPVPTHYSDLVKYIDIIKEKPQTVITTQNIEMLDTLLESDLNIEVITVRKADNVIYSRSLPKEEVRQDRKTFGFEPRL